MIICWREPYSTKDGVNVYSIQLILEVEYTVFLIVICDNGALCNFWKCNFAAGILTFGTRC